MMGRTAPSYLLLLLIGCSFLANVLANKEGKDKKPDEVKHEDQKEDKKDHEQHKDHKDNDDHKHDHDKHDKEQLKEEYYKEFLEFLKALKEDLLEKCGKGDSGKHEDKNGEQKHDKDSGKGKYDHKSADSGKVKDDSKSTTCIHHYHHYRPDGSIKTYSTNNNGGSNQFNHRRDDGNKYPEGYHYDGHDHQDSAGSHDYGGDRVGHRDSHSYDQNFRDHTHDDVYQGRTESIPFDHRHSNGRPVPHEVGEDNCDMIQDSYAHSEYPNEHHGQRTEPRNSRYHDEYDHSHPKFEQHQRHNLDGGATHDIRPESIKERPHYDRREDSWSRRTLNHEGHRVDRPQYHQNGHMYVTDVTHTLPEKSQPQQEWIAHEEPNTYQQPKNSHGSIAHICHYHEHTLRVKELNRQNQQQSVEDTNPCSHPPAHQPAPSFPVDISAIMNIPAHLDSACFGIEQPQLTTICQEPRPPQQHSDSPMEDKPVYMICVPKKLETQFETPRVDPSHYPPPRSEPTCPPQKIDLCSNSYTHQPQQQNVYSNPC